MTGVPSVPLQRMLLDQLAYLIEELEAQKPLLERLPPWVLEGRPFEEAWSVKEYYGVLAAADAEIHLPAVRQLATAPAPALAPPEREALRTREDWNALEITTLLERIQTGRRALVDFLSHLPPRAWQRTGRIGEAERDLQTYVHEIILHDTECLRAIGYRLHESHLTTRPHDLPK
ncbi:DinB family protein [Rhodocaloribacter litoris]|uniref:DinB family protein n=1 Tax=Rhodocaloribacter litoris TaxID=2558931 RepID=UPI001421CDC7|nr:DinB family protein [Rhodocaloribacter litoris]QXD17015.1 DinB family protein [Rhodocaloribacter litoris]